jgi:hypothetical protein
MGAAIVVPKVDGKAVTKDAGALSGEPEPNGSFGSYSIPFG